jgi:hypothetical protein
VFSGLEGESPLRAGISIRLARKNLKFNGYSEIKNESFSRRGFRCSEINYPPRLAKKR